MRIAYLYHWNQGPDSGVYHKICTQVSCWVEAGHEVALYQVGKEDSAWPISCGALPQRLFPYGSGLRSKVAAWANAAGAIGLSRADALYYRYDISLPSLARLSRVVPMVLEVNSDIDLEIRLHGSRKPHLGQLLRPVLFRNSAGFVFVTAELEGRYRIYSRPHLILGNGVFLEDHSEVSEPSSAPVPALVTLAAEDQPWQGIDKVLLLAKLLPRYQFHIVGRCGAAEGSNTPSNVVFHGRLERKEYIRILRRSVVGIGPLALHRKGLNEASPLKAREFLANGLPVIAGYVDTDFPSGDVPFILQVPNVEDNVSRMSHAIEAFVEDWRYSRVARTSITHLDSGAKELRRLAFMEAVCMANASSRPGRPRGA